MTSPVGMICEGLLTIPTLPRFVTGVNTHVILEVVFSLERLSAHFALEWQRIGMDQHVHLQIALPLEAPAAHGTRKRALIFVDREVILEPVRGRKPLAADFTTVRTLVYVLAFVCHHSGS